MWTDWMYYLYCQVVPIHGTPYWYDNYAHKWFIMDDYGDLIFVD